MYSMLKVACEIYIHVTCIMHAVKTFTIDNAVRQYIIPPEEIGQPLSKQGVK